MDRQQGVKIMTEIQKWNETSILNEGIGFLAQEKGMFESHYNVLSQVNRNSSSPQLGIKKIVKQAEACEKGAVHLAAASKAIFESSRGNSKKTAEKMAKLQRIHLVALNGAHYFQTVAANIYEPGFKDRAITFLQKASVTVSLCSFLFYLAAWGLNDWKGENYPLEKAHEPLKGLLATTAIISGLNLANKALTQWPKDRNIAEARSLFDNALFGYNWAVSKVN